MADYIDRNLLAECVDSHNNVHWEDIANTPSEDVVEVRNGTWHKFEKGTGGSLCYGFIVMKTAYRCSQCGKDVWEMSDFCPNCGADMRGGTDG